MGVAGRILLGFFVGFLCGLVPLIYGIISKHKIVSFIALIVSSATGALFSLASKSPFTAMIMSLIFVIFIYSMNNKHRNVEDEEQ